MSNQGELSVRTTPKERVTARVSPDVYSTIHEGAILSGTTINSFMVQAALRQAQELIDRKFFRSFDLVHEADIAWFLSKIEEPFKPNEKLAKAFHRASEVVNERSKHTPKCIDDTV